MKILITIISIMTINNLAFGQTKMELSTKQITKTKTINQPLDSVWWRWTTHEGLKTFFGTDNKIELVPNGAFEIYFLLDNPIGQRGSEDCKVLSLLPKRYFSFSWNAPPQFKDVRNSSYKTWVVVEFKAISSEQTEIVLSHLGWPQDETWNPVFDYFNNAWDFVLNSLAKNDKSK